MKNSQWRLIFIFSLFVGGLLSLFASSFPDGLEKIAGERGFLGRARKIFPSLVSNYQIPGMQNELVSTSLSGVIGICIVFGILFIIGKLLYRSKSTENIV